MLKSNNVLILVIFNDKVAFYSSLIPTLEGTKL